MKGSDKGSIRVLQGFRICLGFFGMCFLFIFLLYWNPLRVMGLRVVFSVLVLRALGLGSRIFGCRVFVCRV